MTLPLGPNPAPTVDIAKTVERARADWAAGRADEAEMACRQVLAVWPGQSDATYLLGLMAYTYGNLDLAIAHRLVQLADLRGVERLLQLAG